MPPLVLEIIVDDKGTPVIRKFSGEVQGFGQHLDKGASQPFQRAAKSGDSFLGSLGGIAKGAVVATAAFAGFHTLASVIGGAASSAAGFQAALLNVNTLGIKSAETQRLLREQVLQLPPALGSSTELARGLYEVLSSGVEPAKAVAFLHDASMLARAGLADLDTATIALTKTMAAYKIPTEDAAKVSDILFKAVEVGQGSLQQFAAAFPQVTQLSASMGVSFVDTANAMATLTQTFRNADTAATGFRSMLQQLIQNSDQFLALGVNIRQVISEEGLIGVARVLQQVSQGSAEKLRLFINDIEGFNAALALTGPQFNTLIENQKKFGQATGIVTEGVKTQSAGASAAWTEFVNTLDRSLQTVAEPALGVFTYWLRNVTLGMSDVQSAMTGKLSPATMAATKAFTDAEDKLRRVQTAFYDTGTATATHTQQTVLAKNAQEAMNKVFTDANAAAVGLAEGLKKIKPGDVAEAIPAKEMAQRIQAVIANLQDMQRSGVFSANEIRQAYETAAVVLKERFGELPPTFKVLFDQAREAAHGTAQGMRQAFTDFGIQTRADLQETALQALRNFKDILDSGKATPQDLLATWTTIINHLNNAGFQTLPPLWAEINGRMQETARKAGEDLPKPYRDAFGAIRLGSTQTFDAMITATMQARAAVEQNGVVPTEAYSVVLNKVNAAVIQYGNNAAVHLDEATRKAAVAYGLLSKAAAEAADNTQKVGEKAHDLGTKGQEAGHKVATAFRSISEVTLGPMFTPFATDLAGIQAQVRLFTDEIADLVNNVYGLSKAFGSSYTYGQYVQDQTHELTKGIGFLNERLVDLYSNTQLASGATNELAEAQVYGYNSARGLANAFEVLGTQSDAALRDMAEQAKTAWRIIRDSGTASAERLQAIWVESVLPRIREAFGHTATFAEQSVSRLAAAFELLGVESDAALEATARASVAAFQTIRNSGQVNAERLREIWVEEVIPDILAAFGEVPAAYAALNAQFNDDLDATAEHAASALGTVRDSADAATASVERTTQAVTRLRGSALAAGGYQVDGYEVGTLRPLPARQHGGPVVPGRTYLVGEEGPEPFVPSTGGTASWVGTRGPSLFQPTVPGVVVPAGQGGGTMAQPAAGARQVTVNVALSINANVMTQQGRRDIVEDLLPELRQALHRGLLDY